jgi:hypothetical protein
VTHAAVALPPDLDERTLVRELTHRVNNQLASAINVVTAAAVRAEHPEAKVALGNVADLLQEHHVLTIPEKRRACRRRSISPQALPHDNAVPFGANWRPSLVSSRYLAAQGGAVQASRDGPPRAGDEFSAACVLRRPSWRDQDQVVAGGPGGQLHHCGQWVALGAVKAGAGPRHRSRFDREPGRSARIWLWPEYPSFLLVFLLTERERRANRAVASRHTRTRRRLKTISSLPNQTTTRQLPNAAGTPRGLHGPTPGSNAPEGARPLGAARTMDKADVLAPLLAKPRI